MDSSLDKFNANKIEDNIYLGGYKTAIDKEFLKKYQIKRILSIHEKEIRDSQKVQNIYYKHIIVEDKKTEEIITYFPECYEYIAIAQTYDESVLIHCQDGVSRSSTIVIAYVMKKYKISVENAIQKVKHFRECVEPNDGFLSQLRLWERISYQIDINNRQLREFLFEVLRTKVNAVLLLNESNLQTLHEKYFPHFLEYFEKIALFEENDRSLNKWETYYCLDCDKELFNEFNVFKSNENSKCRFIYVEPIQWFIAHLVKWSQSLSDLMTGYILCPKCDRELGSYNWQQIEDICDCLSHKGIDFFSVFKINSDCVKTTLNYIRIDKNVYLGDEITATDEEFLKKFNIKRIVSILESEIPDFLKVENIFYKHISNENEMIDDIISYFPECSDFISVAQTYGENILVHCERGVSKSATVVIAFLMQTYKRSFDHEIYLLKYCRPWIDITAHLYLQLRIWQQMSYKIDTNDISYRTIPFIDLKNKILQVFDENDFKVGFIRYFHCFEEYFYKFNLFKENEKLLNRNEGKTYCCRNCDNKLFNEINTIKTHEIYDCQYIYIEPKEWMAKNIETNAKSITDLKTGTISCLKCSQLLGRFDWPQKKEVCDCLLHLGLDYFLAIEILSNRFK